MERSEEFQRGMTLGLIRTFITLIVVTASQTFLNIDQTTLKICLIYCIQLYLNKHVKNVSDLTLNTNISSLLWIII